MYTTYVLKHKGIEVYLKKSFLNSHTINFSFNIIIIHDILNIILRIIYKII
jgi:hypothetical protein